MRPQVTASHAFNLAWFMAACAHNILFVWFYFRFQEQTCDVNETNAIGWAKMFWMLVRIFPVTLFSLNSWNTDSFANPHLLWK